MQEREKLHQGKRLSICAEINHVVIAQETRKLTQHWGNLAVYGWKLA